MPHSLAAVVRKAMSLDRAQRYATVPELQRDLTAYQGGFATSAEHAGLATQLTLLGKRHRGIFATAFAAWLVVTALAVWFVVNVTRERSRAEGALTNLKKTAPTFAEYARSLIEQQRFDDALNAIRSARELDPPNPDYAVQQGHILQTLQRFSEAADAYRAALRVLASISTLEEVVLPPDASPESLRGLPNLKRLSYRSTYVASAGHHPAQTAAEFWAEYDARKAAEKK